MSLILKYSMTLRLALPANRFLMKVPEKPPEMSTGLSTNTATCASITLAGIAYLIIKSEVYGSIG